MHDIMITPSGNTEHRTCKTATQFRPKHYDHPRALGTMPTSGARTLERHHAEPARRPRGCSVQKINPCTLPGLSFNFGIKVQPRHFNFNIEVQLQHQSSTSTSKVIFNIKIRLEPQNSLSTSKFTSTSKVNFSIKRSTSTSKVNFNIENQFEHQQKLKSLSGVRANQYPRSAL